jgi:hypothetical protein
MTGYERSPDYGGPPMRGWEHALAVAAIVVLVFVAWLAFG